MICHENCMDINRLVGKMADAEIDGMLKDLKAVITTQSLWQEGLISEKRYRHYADEFKGKWLHQAQQLLQASY